MSTTFQSMYGIYRKLFFLSLLTGYYRFIDGVYYTLIELCDQYFILLYFIWMCVVYLSVWYASK